MSTPAFNTTNGTAYLQKKYSPRVITNTATMAGSESLKLISEDTTGGGASYNYLADSTDLPAGSADEATAFGYSTDAPTSVGQQYEVPYFTDLFVQSVSGKLIAQTKNQPVKWTKALDKAMKSCINMSSFRTSLAWVSEGWGEVAPGGITSISGATFKLNVASQIRRFAIGMKLVFAASLHADDLRSATPIKILDVNYESGLVTCDTNLSTPGAQANDIPFYAGDRATLASGIVRLRPAGLAALLPNSQTKRADATIATIYGVTRHGRDFGNLIDGSVGLVSSALIKAAQAGRSFGNATSLAAFVSPNKYTELSESLQGSGRYDQTITVAGRGGVGFKLLKIFVDGLEMGVASDRFFDDTTAYCLDLKTCFIRSIGPVPHVDNDDGNSMLRVAGSRAVELRLVQDFHFTIENPAACAVINFVSIA
jgi:hypothetical protein